MHTEEARVARSLTDRMLGAAKLDVSVYEEVEHDPDATSQAATVVAIVALCTAIGSSGEGIDGMVGGLTGAFIGWAVWAAITYWVGTRFFGGVATFEEMLRTLGFAQAPGVIAVLGVVPGIGRLAILVAVVWQLFSGIVAIRQGLDIDTGKAVLVAICGWLAKIAAIVGMVFMMGVVLVASGVIG